MNFYYVRNKVEMNTNVNVDVLAEIISFLDITEDKSILTSCQMIFNLSDNESNQILRTWENNSKYECKVFDNKKEWWVNNKKHREADLPAIEYVDGYKEWWVNGQRHRDNDKPAVYWVNGYKAWYVNGQRHRDNDKPAIEYTDGTKAWYVNGQRHRDNDKPAVEYANGKKEWWVNDKLIRKVM
jgi:hypothetical protein